MVWQQALDFRPDGSERAVLDLDQLVVGDHVDPVVVQRRFDTSAAIGIELLELSVQRRFHEQDRIDKATLGRALICIDPVTGVG